MVRRNIRNPAQKDRQCQHPLDIITCLIQSDGTSRFWTDIGKLVLNTTGCTPRQIKLVACGIQQAKLPPDIAFDPAIIRIVQTHQIKQRIRAIIQGVLRLAFRQSPVQQCTGRCYARKPQGVVKQQSRNGVNQFDLHLSKLVNKPGTPTCPNTITGL